MKSGGFVSPAGKLKNILIQGLGLVKLGLRSRSEIFGLEPSKTARYQGKVRQKTCEKLMRRPWKRRETTNASSLSGLGTRYEIVPVKKKEGVIELVRKERVLESKAVCTEQVFTISGNLAGFVIRDILDAQHR